MCFARVVLEKEGRFRLCGIKLVLGVTYDQGTCSRSQCHLTWFEIEC